MNSQEIKIIIADDHEIFRDGLSLVLKKEKEFNLVDQAINGVDLINKIGIHGPDVVITDIKMPMMDGIEATKVIVDKYPSVKIIALSMFDEDNLIAEMFDAGAKGYLLKNAHKNEIIEAIKTVFDDGNYFCEAASMKLVKMIAKSKQAQKQHQIEFNDREIDIIKFICKQLTAQEIADKVFLSKRTVEGYRMRILEKMNVKNTAGVVVYALRNQLITEEEILD
ncbi:response regulator transcription factor [Solitalea canadensis]|uniref:Response regulator containing a CheY-like receiver domain and an HTH DNA-binding domain n=1 Tax=Solitalea canadensis (strain ATCC 29591 / DSM 3403 / JCM 21819 / LMG 8368 / NBRC 15130 / NCIMB 12057 / USAM 9D) TaxID=929556 RepID=H8KU09_SOLCM|nr:response regulator transcription factor [Solitalea canadensis]AFD06989.1 response regulator containing a CheY-like receiver domain and an HTH DNA-binding domain [Solitalea canadensis DSM 3403]